LLFSIHRASKVSSEYFLFVAFSGAADTAASAAAHVATLDVTH
jgi:hypothetical protein